MAVQSKVDQESIDLMAHLMRRAGFGADRDELEQRAAVGYEATVDELLNPQGQRVLPVFPKLGYKLFLAGYSAVRSPLRAWGVQPGYTT